MEKGKLIVIEGGDGSGKSTLITGLNALLPSKTIFTNDPNSKLPPCIIMRDLLLTKKYDLTRESELLGFMIARRELVDKIIQPALDAGINVITDRFDMSTRGYQGIIRSHSMEDIEWLGKFIKTPYVDLYVYLDIDPVIGVKRSLSRLSDAKVEEDKFESINIDKLRDMRGFFYNESLTHDNIVKVDVNNLTPDETLDSVMMILKKRCVWK